MPALSLPIDPLLPEAVRQLRRHGALVLEAPPGAGKTTRLPRALLDGGLASDAEILVVEPRRLAARLAARRVAAELGEPVGGTVGYSVRFEDVSSPRTRLRFVTEGVFQRRLIAGPDLPGVAAVVLDEFHERHWVGDLALGWLRSLRRSARPDLLVCVMSATLDAEPIAAFLDACPRLRSEGAMFDVAVDHAAQADARPLAAQVASAVRRLCDDGHDGDVLVFLPGAGEIRSAARALEPLAASRAFDVVALHGDLPPAEQDRAVEPGPRRKVILSTNVAETSVTIPGVTAVVDAGLARSAGHSPWTGLPTLELARVSQASLVQRAGRAGRTRPGRVIRLFTRHDFDSRRAYELPEVARADLGEPLLLVHALGVRDPGGFEWLDPPPLAAVAAGERLLGRLGAVDAAGALTEVGARMVRFPVHPRLGRVLVEAERLGVGAAGAALCAMVAEGNIDAGTRVSFRKASRAPGAGGGAMPSGAPESADALERLDRFQQARARRFAPAALRSLDLDARATEAVERARRQLASLVDGRGPVPATPAAIDTALSLAVLSGFPDRVARRRVRGGGEAILAGGGSADVGASPPGDFLVVLAAEQRGEAGRRAEGRIRVRLAVAIEPEWLLEADASTLASSEALEWNPVALRVETVASLRYGAITLEETRRPAPPSKDASRLLGEAARALPWGDGEGGGSLDDLRARVALLREFVPEAGLLDTQPDDEPTLLARVCEGKTSLAEVRADDPRALWLASLPPRVPEFLAREAPERVRLSGGRDVRVRYAPKQPPWIESRLQDFFGMRQGPAICRGRVPLVLHLLAPNGRPVQVTRDLENFWRTHYPSLRRALSRRYPRHAWPETV